MSQSKSIPLEQYQICILPGLAIGYITDGIADLSIDWDAEQDRAYVKRVERITLSVDDLTQKNAPPLSIKPPPASDLFKQIEAEIHRRDDAGDIDLTFDNGDPLYIGLRARASA